MARKINEKLIERMTNGDLKPLLEYLKANKKTLRLEVRRDGKAIVYYKKCKILELGLKSYNIDEKYFENKLKPTDIEKQIIKNPESYFTETINVVDKWLQKHPKSEFETQQNIAIHNQEFDDKYIILDMEYNFSQKEIPTSIKRAGFDLLGIERLTGKVILFEVKKGPKALTGESGIRGHIDDFTKHFHENEKNAEFFKKNLAVDIQNIIKNKKELGLLENFDLPTTLSVEDVDLIFVFEPIEDKDSYNRIFTKELSNSCYQREFETIFISEDNYNLK